MIVAYYKLGAQKLRNLFQTTVSESYMKPHGFIRLQLKGKFEGHSVEITATKLLSNWIDFENAEVGKRIVSIRIPT